MHLTLIRDDSGRRGTFGRLLIWETIDSFRSNEVEPVTMIETVEQPWRNNKPFKSCIPAGEYYLMPFDSPKHGKTWAIVGGSVGIFEDDQLLRFACLFHVANWAHQVQGCIGPGMRRGTGKGLPMVQSSGNAFKLMEKHCSLNQIHTLSIRWA